jgi:hypothetical protein
VYEGLLSVVIPAWNEERRIAPSLERSVETLKRLAPRHEIVVVDDGSADRTLDVAREAASQAHEFRGLRNERNLGKGGAVRRGMLEARGDHILFCDADESTPMATLELFLPALARQDPVVIGTRKNREAVIARHQPWLRETMGKGFTLLEQLELRRGDPLPGAAPGLRHHRGSGDLDQRRGHARAPAARHPFQPAGPAADRRATRGGSLRAGLYSVKRTRFKTHHEGHEGTRRARRFDKEWSWLAGHLSPARAFLPALLPASCASW